MQLRKFKFLLVIFFAGIFTAKMCISAAPLFFPHLDKELINSVIMQIEQEHETDNDSGKVLKYVEFKLISHNASFIYLPVVYDFGIDNSFVDHNKRYVNPYHPSVPTPPPNFS